ncbi:hypothetical protein [Streptomyces sp. NPDC056682]|uniref:hypothetical protein n=1 Tax=Streptomyces sp. NPDC056682 TaxID=3345909 RepID=UPI0036B326C5
MSETEEQQSPPRARPTRAELADATDRLVAEIDTAFASDRWVILRSETPQTTWRLYDGAALRHCAQLLRELAAAIDAGMEFGVRILMRSLVEAAVLSVYIHFGKFEAVEAVARAARHSLEGVQKEADHVDERLAKRVKKARKSAKRLRAHHANNPYGRNRR